MPQPQTGHVPKRFSLLRENSSSLPLAASSAGLGEGVGPPRHTTGRRPISTGSCGAERTDHRSDALWVFFAAGPALHAQEASVGLGTADDFAVLGGTTITNTGPTTITGDVGLDPGIAVTGFETVDLNGTLHLDDAVALQAKVDLVTAYDDAATRTATSVATGLGGQTLTEGAYDSAAGTFGMTGTLTLDAQDDPNAVFVFQMASTLITRATDNRKEPS